MNSLIEAVNGYGDSFLRFAWPTLWQSSLLIALIAIVDLALRRKLRAAVRYALWLVVLLKLLLPPSLALPTGVAWWLSAKEVSQPKTAATFIVTYSQSGIDPAPAEFQSVTPPTAPKPSAPAWIFLGACIVSVSLLCFLLFRWRQMVRRIRQAWSAPESYREMLSEARRAVGLRREIGLRITADAISPAVCGLFRPVVLLPESLAEHLSPEQIRAVLLHELIHLRRGDVWMNCLQTLLQIVYWWHPLLWPANARIRRLREEAVDDAVMLALNKDAEVYAPTLIEVAKLAFRRPLSMLGFVGILESRTALRRRIERLVNFTAPGRAGLSLVSFLAIATFAAAAVPMGQAPPTPKAEEAAPSDSAKTSQTDQLVSAQTNSPFAPPGMEAIMTKLQHIRLRSVSYQKLPLREVVGQLAEQVKRADPDGTGMEFQIFSNDVKSVSITLNPALTNILLADVVRTIVEVADKPIKYSITDDGVVFSHKTGLEAAPLVLRRFKVDPNTFYAGLQAVGLLTPEQSYTGGFTNFIRAGTPTSAALNPGAVTTVNKAVVKFFDQGGISLTPGESVYFNDREGTLLVRATADDQGAIERLLIALRMGATLSPQVNIKATFVEIAPDDAKALSFDWYLENFLMGNNAAGGSSMPQSSNPGAPSSANPGGTPSDISKSGTAQSFTGILTQPQFRVIMRIIKQRKGSSLLKELQVTTLSGRQAQIQMGDTKTLVTAANTVITNGWPQTIQTTNVLFGPVLDVVPYVQQDNATVELDFTATVNEFLGYFKPDRGSSEDSLLERGLPIPRIRVRKASSKAMVWDGQTIVLGGFSDRVVTKSRGSSSESDFHGANKKQLFVFLTPTLIDPAGNAIHSETGLPQAKTGIPPQGR